MDIKAEVYTIEELKKFFFIVPDYQREYVWKPDDEVEQFLADIEVEYEPGRKEQHGYFIGSIILVKNGNRYDVIDGQQRLTTIILTLCAIRDALGAEGFAKRDLSERDALLQVVNELLYKYDLKTKQKEVRLDLQYDDSKDYLKSLIKVDEYAGPITKSIDRMQQAYAAVAKRLVAYSELNGGVLGYVNYFLSNIELVVIESEDLSNALKIFETINQRGAGLNAMDLVKNLIFSKAREEDFSKVKVIWKELTQELDKCKDPPLRFLRYFMVARYSQTMLREDTLYKWIISPEGKSRLKYTENPVKFAQEILACAKKYVTWLVATESGTDHAIFPRIAGIGFINKFRSRLHLLLLLSLGDWAKDDDVEYLAAQVETYLFVSMVLGILAKDHETRFLGWAQEIRTLKNRKQLERFVENTMKPWVYGEFGRYRSEFMNMRISDLTPLYRIRYVLGQLDRTVDRLAGQPDKNHTFYEKCDLEHTLPQTPKGALPAVYKDKAEYLDQVNMLGNAMLLESGINQALNHSNDLSGPWFKHKLEEYGKSSLTSAKLTDETYGIGKKTSLNRLRDKLGFGFKVWDRATIQQRQEIYFQLALETWLINGESVGSEA